MALSSESVSRLTDRQLMERLLELARKDSVVMAELLAHLGEIDARRLCDREAEGSLFAYCVKVLNFSEGEAYKRIGAARAARSYPVILEMVGRGDLHLTAVNMLAAHLTDENHRRLLGAAVRKSKREVQELLAMWFPKPDAPTLLRKLPELACAPVVARGAGSGASSGRDDTRPEAGAPAFEASGPSSSAAPQVASGRGPVMAPAFPADRGSVAPLSPDRYRLQVTLSGATREKLLRAQALMRHAQPDGDLAVVLDRALACLVEQLESRKFGRLKQPRAHGEGSRAEELADGADGAASGGEPVQPAPEPPERAESSPSGAGERVATRETCSGQTEMDLAAPELVPAPVAGRVRRESAAADTARTRGVPRAIKRAVAERDDFRCTYVAADGRRCEARGCLEYHHLHPHARGGEASVANLTLRCKSHNLVDAVADFGADAVRTHGRRG